MEFKSKEAFQGLNIHDIVNVDSNIAAIVGRNGAGKTRLLKGIAEGKIMVSLDGEWIPQSGIKFLSVAELQPALIFGFNRVQHVANVQAAQVSYRQLKSHFRPTAAGTIDINHHVARSQSNVYQILNIARQASQTLSKQIDSLDDEDIADFYSFGTLHAMGTLSVTETMLAYLVRMEENNYNEFRNATYGERRPHYTPTEFVARFGPAPWDAFNHFLGEVLSGQYYIDAPQIDDFASYEAQIKRSSDHRVIDPSMLSSGEKVLMWLCLVMYSSDAGRMLAPPRLLLLDEPDGALHPQMVQKMHQVLKNIAERFGSGIVFSTHSPTTVALFDAGPILRVSESDLATIEKDAAIADLLVGLDQVSVHYTKAKTVYVESYKDAEVYDELFKQLRRWNKGVSEHLSLAFVPAAPKLTEHNIQKILNATLGTQDPERVNAFVKAMNGQGDCEQVKGAVESLINGGIPAYGLIDWDATNKPSKHVVVLGHGIFYSLENAILNPVSLGFYLLQFFPDKVLPSEFGIASSYDLIALYGEPSTWQALADGFTIKVFGELAHSVECEYVNGNKLMLDAACVHMNGHDLEAKIKEVFPFLRAFSGRRSLLKDVVNRGFAACQGRTVPMAFREAFAAIQ